MRLHMMQLRYLRLNFLLRQITKVGLLTCVVADIQINKDEHKLFSTHTNRSLQDVKYLYLNVA